MVQAGDDLVVVRGEDSSWLDEPSMSFDPETGLLENLGKSKTTGPGKKVKHREVFVSIDAYIQERDWLKEGWEIWQRAPAPRQNFISLFLTPPSKPSGTSAQKYKIGLH